MSFVTPRLVVKKLKESLLCLRMRSFTSLLMLLNAVYAQITSLLPAVASLSAFFYKLGGLCI